MGPHPEHVQPPSTAVRQLRRTTPIERPQVQHGGVRIETGGSMQPHTKKMPELQGESYGIERNVHEENRGHHNGLTGRDSATEWTGDKGHDGGQQTSARLQTGCGYNKRRCGGDGRRKARRHRVDGVGGGG